MRIIIVGCGKVGRTLTEQLSDENHDVTVVDTNPQVVQDVTNNFDVMGVVGNGASYLDGCRGGKCRSFDLRYRFRRIEPVMLSFCEKSRKL